MKKTACIVALIVVLGLPVIAGDPPRTTLADLEWLLGTWQRQQENGYLYEYWERGDSTYLSGRGYTVEGKYTVTVELMKMLQTDTAMFFVATVPHNDSSIYFRLISADSGGMVFENPKHDFPTRVIYRAMPPDSMFARIEARIDGQVKGIDFLFSRVK